MNTSDPSGQRSDLPAPRPIDIDQRFDANDLSALRSTLVAHVRGMDADQDWIEDLLIVAGELTSNAVRHGGGAGRLRLWHAEHLVYCEVTDDGPGIPDPTVGTALPDPGCADGGRGLWLCRHLASELIIQTRPGRAGTVVTALIPAPNQRAHRGAPSGARTGEAAGARTG